MLKEGDKIPDFQLSDTNDNLIISDELKGHKVVLYFYPEDMTPGCTVESCEFRDFMTEFQELGVKVYGVSLDDIESHQNFTEKHNLNFPLLADEEGELSKSFGVLGSKTNKGKEYIGIYRTTFIIDENGIIEKVYSQVEPEGHAKEVLEYLK